MPASGQQFTSINELWYSDAAAARAQVGGGAGEAAPAAASEPATAAAPAAGEVESAADSAAEAAPAEEAPAAEAVAAAAAPQVVATVATQVVAEDDEEHGPVVVPHYAQPSPLGIVAFAGMAITFALMWIVPGPKWLEIADVEIAAGVVILAPVFAIFTLLFVSTRRTT